MRHRQGVDEADSKAFKAASPLTRWLTTDLRESRSFGRAARRNDEDLGPGLQLELRALVLPHAAEDAEYLPVDVLGKQLRDRPS